MTDTIFENRINPKPTKLFGTYPQKQEGLFMQRIPIFAGNITADQLRQIAEIAIELTGSTPLHLTTRQDIEFHNVADADAQTVLDRIEAVGFATFGAGSDSLRNITVCPCCKFNADAWDVEPLAIQMKQAFGQSDVLDQMHRKFKVSFAGCADPKSRPYANCLAFIATSADTVKVVGAGSLGPKPETGIVLFEELSIDEVIPLGLAAAKLFAEHGDRENRRKARLRHVRQRLGDAAFVELLNEYFDGEKKLPQVQQQRLSKGLATTKIATIQTIAGNLDVQDALSLAKAVQDAGAHIRINLSHGIDIYSENSFELPSELQAFTDLPMIIACPGNTTCPNGLANCPEAAARLSKALKGSGTDKTIAISGCPNGCAHSAIADIGLTGQMKTIDGERQQAYKIMTGADNAKTGALNEAKETIKDSDLEDRVKFFLS
ncbi:MAG: nitrite/sulfite reductase [Planctomycetes bacterium]|nr:nitrite/sulfite reductase [Planctomycetota bacterium]